MPASTGTEGRDGRLRAVQATASASTSRATRNFISRPTSAQPATDDGVVPPRTRDLPCSLRCSSCLVWSSGGKLQPLPDPFGASRSSVPTQTGVRENFEISPSSSSSLVWKLGRTTVGAGRHAHRHVGPLWVAGVFLLSTRGQLEGRAHDRGSVHGLSPVRPRPIPPLSAGPVPSGACGAVGEGTCWSHACSYTRGRVGCP